MRQYYFVTTTTEGDNQDQFFVIAESVEDARTKVPLDSGENIESISLLGGLNIGLRGMFGEQDDVYNTPQLIVNSISTEGMMTYLQSTFF